MSWLLALAAVASMPLAPTLAHAEPTEARAGDRIAVIGPSDGAVAMQLEAELQLLGFEVVQIENGEQSTVDDLQQLARELGVAAVIRVDAREGELVLWVVDRVTGKTVIRTVQVGADADAARIAAVRAIDLLRASFRELEERPRPPEAEVASTPIVRRAIRARAPRFGIALAPMIAGAVGGLGPTAHVALAFEAMPHPRFGLGVRAVAPIAGAHVSAAQGSARVHVGWATIGPRMRLRPADRTVLPSVGLGVGPAFVGMRGDAKDGYVARRDLVTTAIFELDTSLAIAVHPRLRVWLDAAIGGVVPNAAIRFAGERVASWGWVVGTGAVGLQVVL